MKGVNWSSSRKVLEAITVCLGITFMVSRGLIRLNCIIATTILLRRFPSTSVWFLITPLRGPLGWTKSLYS
jgi:hypothetical protein